jgi:hypothetical protein
MVVIERYLARHARKSRWELSAGVVVSKQDVGNGVPVLHAEEPGLENRRGFSGELGDGERPSVHENGDDRFPVSAG